jgi:apolipoprotein N-acyltransferase
MDFPALGRLYGEAGVGLLLVAAWDFGRDGRLHARMAVVRGVESGFALVRTAQRGLLTVSDDRGRVVAEMPSGEGPEALLTARVAPGSGRTPYARWGDWFGWLCLLLLAAALVRTTVQRRIAFRGRSINVAA